MSRSSPSPCPSGSPCEVGNGGGEGEGEREWLLPGGSNDQIHKDSQEPARQLNDSTTSQPNSGGGGVTPDTSTERQTLHPPVITAAIAPSPVHERNVGIDRKPVGCLSLRSPLSPFSPVSLCSASPLSGLTPHLRVCCSDGSTIVGNAHGSLLSCSELRDIQLEKSGPVLHMDRLRFWISRYACITRHAIVLYANQHAAETGQKSILKMPLQGCEYRLLPISRTPFPSTIGAVTCNSHRHSCSFPFAMLHRRLRQWLILSVSTSHDRHEWLHALQCVSASASASATATKPSSTFPSVSPQPAATTQTHTNRSTHSDDNSDSVYHPSIFTFTSEHSTHALTRNGIAQTTMSNSHKADKHTCTPSPAPFPSKSQSRIATRDTDSGRNCTECGIRLGFFTRSQSCSYCENVFCKRCIMMREVTLALATTMTTTLTTSNHPSQSRRPLCFSCWRVVRMIARMGEQLDHPADDVNVEQQWLLPSPMSAMSLILSPDSALSSCRTRISPPLSSSSTSSTHAPFACSPSMAERLNRHQHSHQHHTNDANDDDDGGQCAVRMNAPVSALDSAISQLPTDRSNNNESSAFILHTPTGMSNLCSPTLTLTGSSRSTTPMSQASAFSPSSISSSLLSPASASRLPTTNGMTHRRRQEREKERVKRTAVKLGLHSFTSKQLKQPEQEYTDASDDPLSFPSSDSGYVLTTCRDGRCLVM